MNTLYTWLTAACLITMLTACHSPGQGEPSKAESPESDSPEADSAQAENAPGFRDAGQLMIVDFRKGMDLDAWEVEDDVVMGGRSSGHIKMNTEGHALFFGEVSLENNGGFSSVQHYFEPIDISAYDTACIRLKGDGKNYRFLVEGDPQKRHYYVYPFQTTGQWQTIEVPLRQMYPEFRGDRLNRPNYPGETLSMVRIMISNKQAESFRIEIDAIWLK